MDNEINYISKNLENQIKEILPNKNVCNKLTNLYSIFSDSTRIKILISLLMHEMCVNDLSRILNVHQTTISHQLKLLKSYGVVDYKRINKFNFYKVTDKFIESSMINGFDYIIQKKVV